MSRQDDIGSLVGSRLYVGTSVILGVTVIPGMLGAVYKYAFGGSCEVGGATLSWGIGYMLGGGETVNANMAGTIYFCSTGATSVIMMLRARSPGILDL